MAMTNQELVDLVSGALGRPGPLTDEQMLRLLQRMRDVIKYSPSHRDGILRRTYLALGEDIVELGKTIPISTDKVQAPV